MSTVITYHEQLLPDGEYDAVITSVEPVTIRGDSFLRIAAKIRGIDPERDGVTVSTLLEPRLARGTRLARFFEAATGKALADGEAVDLDEMAGCEVRVRVENRRGPDEIPRPRIVGVLPRS